MNVYKVSLMEMTMVINGCTFTKKIGEHKIYSEEYGRYIPGSEDANDFNTMALHVSGWLTEQD